MNKILLFIPLLLILSGCKTRESQPERTALAKVGETILYYDQVPSLTQPGTSKADSTAIVQNYINNWARKELLFLKAQDNLAPENKNEIEKQLAETRANLVIYQYQRQMMIEKMDTTITEEELEAYYAANEKSFTLSSNIVKALFIKVPIDVPALDKIRTWSRSSDQKDLQQLETTCYQFAEKFDDFNEEWVTIDRLSVELPQEINNQDQFLKYNTSYETRDSASIYLISFRDYRLRYSLAPFDYVKNDIKSIILNNRRFEFLQSLENGIYNEGLKANLFKLY
jgi:hypothetical protein